MIEIKDGKVCLIDENYKKAISMTSAIRSAMRRAGEAEAEEMGMEDD